MKPPVDLLTEIWTAEESGNKTIAELCALILKDREEVKEACAKRCDSIVDVLPHMAGAAKRQAKGCADSIRALDLTGEKP